MRLLLDMHWHIPVCVCLEETLSENVVHFGVTSWTSGKGWGGGPLAGANPLGFGLEKLLRCPGASHVWERGCWVGRVISSLSFNPDVGTYTGPQRKHLAFPYCVSSGGWQAPPPAPPPTPLCSLVAVAIIYLFPRKCQHSAKSGQRNDRKYSLPPLLIYVSLLNLKPTEAIGKFIFSSVPISATLKLDWT